MSDSVLDFIKHQADVSEAAQQISYFDDQSAMLVEQVWSNLRRDFQMNSRQEEAMARILRVITNPKMQPDLLRNTVFKAANALGIKLPSSMFASAESVAERAIAREFVRRTAATPIDAAKLPKPSQWSVPIPWDEAKVQVAANLNMFVAVGCAVRKIRPVADPYARLVYKGMAFEVSLGKRVAGTVGNLWVEPEDAKEVAAKMSQLVGTVAAFKRIAEQGAGTVDRPSLFAKIAPKYASKWADALALGIAETMLELGGVAVVATVADLDNLPER